MCLSSLVGIRASCASTGSYTFFIDDTPGINLKNAAAVADTTGIALLNKSILNGANQVQAEINEELIGRFRLNEKIKPFSLGNFTTDYMSVSRSGFNIEKICNSCRLASLFISSVEFQTKEDFAGKVVIKVGNEITEYTVTSNAKIKSYVTIDRLVNSNEFEIYLEQEDGLLFELLKTNASCLSGEYNLTLIGNGLIKLNGYWQCDIEKIFCEFKTLFGRAVLLSSGAFFFEEVAMTDRVNYYTVYKSPDDAIEQKHILNSRYQKQIKVVITKLYPLLKKFGGCCIDCTGSGWAYQLP